MPGLNSQSGNIIGPGFGSITVPDSCVNHECTRTFSELQGIHATGNEYRLDVEKPINDSLSVFAKARYTQTTGTSTACSPAAAPATPAWPARSTT